MKTFKVRLISLWRRNKVVKIKSYSAWGAKIEAERLYSLDYEIINVIE